VEVTKFQEQAGISPTITCLDIKSNSKAREHRPRENGRYDMSSNYSLSSTSSTSLVSSALRQQILALYASHYETASDYLPITDSQAWLSTLPATPSPLKALETAAYAVSLARFAATLDAPNIKQESLKLYTQGLRRTQMALEDPKLLYSDETLGACMLLGIYEIFECPGGSRGAYRSHYSTSSTK
jgi:hypothetical protein